MANVVSHPTTGASMEYRGLLADTDMFPTWDRAVVREFGRLTQGVGGSIEGSNTICFIPRASVTKAKTVTYGRFVVDVRPNKEEVHCVIPKIGGKLIQYPGDVSTRSADLTTSMWNSNIYMVGAKYMCLDVKTFYLRTPMDSCEYLRIPIMLIPQ
jgi:hypothetical protein